MVAERLAELQHASVSSAELVERREALESEVAALKDKLGR